MAITEKNMAVVKRHLNITWDDEDTNAKLENIIKDARIALDHQLGISAGIEVNYFNPGMERRLFLAYILYAWNDALDEFDSAYKSEIIKLRGIYAVKRRRSKDEDQA